MRSKSLGMVLAFLLFTSGSMAQSSLGWEAVGWVAKTAAEALISGYVQEQLKKYLSQPAVSGTPQENYDAGLRYLRAGDETRAVEFLKKSAGLDYPLAECLLGDLAFKNLNYAAAREYYEQAAVKHNWPWAQFQMGNLAAYGYLGRPDYEGALHWYRAAAKQRDPKAEYALGSLLLSGVIHYPTEAEKREAASAIEDAAQQGLPHAEAEMSYVYGAGVGRPPDTCAAVKWAQKAAQKDIGAALYNLGVASHNGDCLPPDNLIAVDYYRRAIQAGYQDAVSELNRTEAYLRQELQRLSQAAGQSRFCPLSEPEAPVYDISGNVTGRLQPSVRDVVVTASEANNDFVRISGGGFIPSKALTCRLFNLPR